MTGVFMVCVASNTCPSSLTTRLVDPRLHLFTRLGPLRREGESIRVVSVGGLEYDRPNIWLGQLARRENRFTLRLPRNSCAGTGERSSAAAGQDKDGTQNSPRLVTPNGDVLLAVPAVRVSVCNASRPIYTDKLLLGILIRHSLGN